MGFAIAVTEVGPAEFPLLQILRDPVMSHPAIEMEMLMSLLPEVVASDTRLPLLQISSPIEAREFRWRAIDAYRASHP